jgi:hypothetical protein
MVVEIVLANYRKPLYSLPKFQLGHDSLIQIWSGIRPLFVVVGVNWRERNREEIRR